MQKDLELRRAVKRLGRRGPGRRFPDALREKLIKYLGARREAGGRLREIAVEVGVNWRTVGRWLKPSAAIERFCPVEVVVPPPVHRAVVRGPYGIVVEGLDLGGIAELIRRLG
jgi:hypothetical protein